MVGGGERANTQRNYAPLRLLQLQSTQSEGLQSQSRSSWPLLCDNASSNVTIAAAARGLGRCCCNKRRFFLFIAWIAVWSECTFGLIIRVHSPWFAGFHIHTILPLLAWSLWKSHRQNLSNKGGLYFKGTETGIYFVAPREQKCVTIVGILFGSNRKKGKGFPHHGSRPGAGNWSYMWGGSRWYIAGWEITGCTHTNASRKYSHSIGKRWCAP